ncbi:hypothetical protein CDAR_299081 [Caerostris darwini]|uniref:Uncharacterized protein n=1 Tax=Caerostris darwini TaxID=1538125 RepID=A0AAV4PFY0_9ARAC|nr:hypothetical protein CDAR_299081 [Caerostris darwini]
MHYKKGEGVTTQCDPCSLVQSPPPPHCRCAESSCASSWLPIPSSLPLTGPNIQIQNRIEDNLLYKHWCTSIAVDKTTVRSEEAVVGSIYSALKQLLGKKLPNNRHIGATRKNNAYSAAGGDLRGDIDPRMPSEPFLSSPHLPLLHHLHHHVRVCPPHTTRGGRG